MPCATHSSKCSNKTSIKESSFSAMASTVKSSTFFFVVAASAGEDSVFSVSPSCSSRSSENMRCIVLLLGINRGFSHIRNFDFHVHFEAAIYNQFQHLSADRRKILQHMQTLSVVPEQFRVGSEAKGCVGGHDRKKLGAGFGTESEHGRQSGMNATCSLGTERESEIDTVQY